MNKIYSEDKFFEFIEENVKNFDDDWNAGYSLLKAVGQLEIPAELMNNGIATVLEIIGPPHEFKYGDVIGDPNFQSYRAVFLPTNDYDEEPWLTSGGDGWRDREWADEQLDGGWVIDPDGKQGKEGVEG